MRKRNNKRTFDGQTHPGAHMEVGILNLPAVGAFATFCCTLGRQHRTDGSQYGRS
jgi:hypothetical protein